MWFCVIANKYKHKANTAFEAVEVEINGLTQFSQQHLNESIGHVDSVK